MIRIKQVFTSAEVRKILEDRGLHVCLRPVEMYDGDRLFFVDKWQVWNPFRMEWRDMEEVFRNVTENASTAILVERLGMMNLDEYFK